MLKYKPKPLGERGLKRKQKNLEGKPNKSYNVFEEKKKEKPKKKGDKKKRKRKEEPKEKREK
jgi:hypothetical protein